MAKLGLKQRIGVDIGRRVSVEQGLEWAATNDVHFIDVQTDIDPNKLESFDKARCDRVCQLKEQHAIYLGLMLPNFHPFVGMLSTSISRLILIWQFD